MSINWRRGILRLWLIGTGIWMVINGAALIKDGGFDFSDRALKIEVQGEEFVFPWEDSDAMIVSQIVAQSAAKAQHYNEGTEKRCSLAKERKSETAPKGEVDLFKALGVETLECLPSIGLQESMVIGPVFEGRTHSLPPLRVAWLNFLEWGLAPPVVLLASGRQSTVPGQGQDLERTGQPH